MEKVIAHNESVTKQSFETRQYKRVEAMAEELISIAMSLTRKREKIVLAKRFAKALKKAVDTMKKNHGKDKLAGVKFYPTKK